MKSFYKGANWYLFFGENSDIDAAIRHQLQAARGDKNYCSIRVLGEDFNQLVTAPANAEGQICAALLLASTKSSLVFLERITLDTYWLVVISAGRVLSGYDFTGTLEQVEYKLEDLTGLLINQSVEFNFFADERSLPVLAKYTREQVTETTLDALIAPLSYEVERNASLTFVQNNLPKTYMGLLVKLGGFALVFLAVIWGYGIYQDHLREKELAEAISLKSPEEIRAERILQQKKAMLSEIESSSLKRLGQNALILLRKLPKSLGSWKLTQVEFDRRSKQAKVYYLQSQGGKGEIALFKQGLAKVYPNVDVSYSTDGTQIRFNLPLDVPPPRMTLADFDSWQSGASFPLSSYIDQLATYHFQWNLSEPSNKVTPNQAIPYRRLELTITSDAIRTLVPFTEIFKDYKGLVFDSIAISPSPQNTVWTFKGFIYEFK